MATQTRTHGTAAYEERASGCGTLHHPLSPSLSTLQLISANH